MLQQSKGKNFLQKIKAMEIKNTYKTFDELSKADIDTLKIVRKYIGTEKMRSFKSYKTFWKKYENTFIVIGNGTFDDPQFYIGLMVENPHYIGQPYTIRLTNWEQTITKQCLI